MKKIPKKRAPRPDEETSDQNQPAPTGWLTGDYQRYAEYKIMLPYEFLMVCKLFDVTPREVIMDFVEAVSANSLKFSERQERITKAAEYMVGCGYGAGHYSDESRAQIFEELRAIGRLWPHNAPMDIIDTHADWRDRYFDYWFDKWFHQTRRK